MNARSPFPHGLFVEVRGLRKRYGERDVLKALDLHIAPGQFVAVVGRSGCGKSTLLRLLAGLETAGGGELLANLGPLASSREGIRLMFQDARLLPWKTVIDNVGLGLTGDWRPRALQALAEVGLAERASDWPAALSGGQKQRVALARALITDPALILADEPTGNLDRLTGAQIMELLFGLSCSRALSLVMVTHSPETAALCDRVLELRDGLLQTP
jgi:sulfonate transport system ATP-binding protein